MNKQQALQILEKALEILYFGRQITPEGFEAVRGAVEFLKKESPEQ